MPFSSGSVLFLGLQQLAKPWSWPLKLIYVLEETEHEGNNKSIQNVSSLGEEGVVPHAGEWGLLPPSSTMIEACGAEAVMGSGCILKVKATESADRLDVRSEQTVSPGTGLSHGVNNISII